MRYIDNESLVVQVVFKEPVSPCLLPVHQYSHTFRSQGGSFPHGMLVLVLQVGPPSFAQSHSFSPREGAWEASLSWRDGVAFQPKHGSGCSGLGDRDLWDRAPCLAVVVAISPPKE